MIVRATNMKKLFLIVLQNLKQTSGIRSLFIPSAEQLCHKECDSRRYEKFSSISLQQQ